MHEKTGFYFYSSFVVLLATVVAAFPFAYFQIEFRDAFPELIKPERGFPFLFYLVINVIAAILSFTTLLNLMRYVRDSLLLSFLSFFWVVLALWISLIINIGDQESGFMFLILLPFIIPQTYFFITFRRKLKNSGS